MKKLIFLHLLWLFFLPLNSFAQDKIILKSGEEKEAWVFEQSDKTVKYRLMNTVASPIIILKTNKIEKIIYRNGTETIFIPPGIRMQKRFAINGGLMIGLGKEVAFYKLQADYFVKPELNIELNTFAEVEGGGGLSVGAKYYFNPHRPKKLKGYAGLLIGSIWDDFIIQIPVGLNFTTKAGFDLKFGLNSIYTPSYSDYTIFPELLLGWRF